MMLLSVHFTLEELTHSQTAARLGIRNEPTPEDVTNLRRLCVDVLEPLRAATGTPVIVSSGYRAVPLNKAVGGSAKSAHCNGLAADILVPGMTPLEVCHLIVKLKLPFEQLIHEFGEWTHVSIPAFGKPPKREVLTAKRDQGKTIYIKGLQ